MSLLYFKSNQQTPLNKNEENYPLTKSKIGETKIFIRERLID